MILKILDAVAIGGIVAAILTAVAIILFAIAGVLKGEKKPEEAFKEIREQGEKIKTAIKKSSPPDNQSNSLEKDT